MELTDANWRKSAFGRFIDTQEHFNKLKVALSEEEETTEENKEAAKILERMCTAYEKRHRTRLDGPRSLGKHLELREDFYSYAFLHHLKRTEIFRDGKDAEEEEKKRLTMAEKVGKHVFNKAESNLPMLP